MSWWWEEKEFVFNNVYLSSTVISLMAYSMIIFTCCIYSIYLNIWDVISIHNVISLNTVHPSFMSSLIQVILFSFKLCDSSYSPIFSPTFPAASRPTMRILISFFPNILSHIREKCKPILLSNLLKLRGLNLAGRDAQCQIASLMMSYLSPQSWLDVIWCLN